MIQTYMVPDLRLISYVLQLSWGCLLLRRCMLVWHSKAHNRDYLLRMSIVSYKYPAVSLMLHLPLSHLAGQCFDHHSTILSGYCRHQEDPLGLTLLPVYLRNDQRQL